MTAGADSNAARSLARTRIFERVDVGSWIWTDRSAPAAISR